VVDEATIVGTAGHLGKLVEVYEWTCTQAMARRGILEVYADAYEVECSDSDGSTVWLEAMYPDEMESAGT